MSIYCLLAKIPDRRRAVRCYGRKYAWLALTPELTANNFNKTV